MPSERTVPTAPVSETQGWLCSDDIIAPLCPADAEQCKYGKNRVEADAKRLQAKEEELMKRKQEIRNHLTQLKKERTDLRAAVEAAAGQNAARKESLISVTLFN